MLNDIFAFIFSVQCTALIFVLIGAYALLWWSIDNFKSIVQIVTSFLVPYFQPQEDLPLSEKFGSWAGMCNRLNRTIDFFNRRLINKRFIDTRIIDIRFSNRTFFSQSKILLNGRFFQQNVVLRRINSSLMRTRNASFQ